jgi:RimJ/RimL family protein N-acetyltransferase
MVNYRRREPWNRRLKVGYILAQPYWRQGLMREAMAPFIDYCIEKLDKWRYNTRPSGATRMARSYLQ